MNLHIDMRPRLRCVDGKWQLSPRFCPSPRYTRQYVGTSALSVYEHWIRDCSCSWYAGGFMPDEIKSTVQNFERFRVTYVPKVEA